MKKQYVFLVALCGFWGMNQTALSSEFDQYLQQKNILDQNFKIIDKPALTELVTALSEEDSKTFPIEVDHNTILEKLEMDAEKTILTGMIITPDFNQFEKDLGKKEVTQFIRKNLINNCPIFFEHEYQRHNPYTVELKLHSTTNTYEFSLAPKDCGI
jgi:hypothetical protein